MSNDPSSGGMGLCGVLTVVFVVLKLVGTINWSWFWVLSPLIFSIGLTLILLFLVAMTKSPWNNS